MTLLKKISIAAISAAVLAGSLLPANAMPLPAAPAVKTETGSDVLTVQYREGWYGGHRGYRDRRPGYRYYNGYWFPLAAFGAGALIGGAIASQPRYVEPAYGGDINPRHYEWCSARYRSYDAYSNTFQPNYGPRQECLSPYY